MSELKGESEMSEISKFISSMNDQLNYMEENIGGLLKIKQKLVSEPVVENSEKAKDVNDDILSKLKQITTKFEIHNSKFSVLVGSLNKLI